MILNVLAAGFSIGYLILRFLGFASMPWNADPENLRRFFLNWALFFILLVLLPAGCPLIPMLLGRMGQFNPETQAWNTACMDPEFTVMFTISYLSIIGNPYTINIYARDQGGHYYYLGLLPSTDPLSPNIKFTTPHGILYPTTTQINSDVAAGQQLFAINPGNSPLQLITSFEMNATKTETQSISAKCVIPSDQNSNITQCVNGMLITEHSKTVNPLLKSVSGPNRTLAIQYDIIPDGLRSGNFTFLTGYAGTWPSSAASFMSASGIPADIAPYGHLVEVNSKGVKVNGEGVKVISSPWPGCGGLKVCGTSGLNALIVAGWIWENLEQWMWYSQQDCLF